MPEREEELHEWELIGADLADAFCHLLVAKEELANCICPGLEPGQFIMYTALPFDLRRHPS